MTDQAELVKWVLGAHFGLGTIAFHSAIRYAARATDGATVLDYWSKIRKGISHHYVESLRTKLRSVMENSEPSPSAIIGNDGNPLYTEAKGIPLESEQFRSLFTDWAASAVPEIVDYRKLLSTEKWHDRFCALRSWTSLSFSGVELGLFFAIGISIYLLEYNVTNRLHLIGFVPAALMFVILFVSFVGVNCTESTLRKLKKRYYDF